MMLWSQGPCTAHYSTHNRYAPHPKRRTGTVAQSSNMPQTLSSLVKSFQAVPDPMQRYRQLLYLAKGLEPIDQASLNSAFKVPGCVSQVWIIPTSSDGRIYYQADSDSQLTKGLAALLVKGLSGNTPEDIISVGPEFIELLGLNTALTPSRTNGLLNMFKLMQAQASELSCDE
mmetsp:Transcript_2697/g.9693  ORF Transcript_2697/g.9693 Transcript_2697/m.9693 type:complete len:173 (+) Transcript_2697:173-691(+)